VELSYKSDNHVFLLFPSFQASLGMSIIVLELSCAQPCTAVFQFPYFPKDAACFRNAPRFSHALTFQFLALVKAPLAAASLKQLSHALSFWFLALGDHCPLVRATADDLVEI